MFISLLIFLLDLIKGIKNSCFHRARLQTSAMNFSDILPAKIQHVVFQFQNPCAHSLTSALHYMVPVRPRRQIVYPLEKLGINAPSKQVSKDQVGNRSSRKQKAKLQLNVGFGRWDDITVLMLGGCFLITLNLMLLPFPCQPGLFLSLHFKLRICKQWPLNYSECILEIGMSLF